MKTDKLKIWLIIIISVILVGSIPASSQNTGKIGGNSKSIALISTMIGKIIQSPIPLLDAGPFNKKTNSIAPFIIEEQVKSVDGFRESVASSMKKHINCEVLYGSALTTKPEYIEISKKYNFPDNLKIDDENFPKIQMPKDEMNPFMFDNGRKVAEYLKNEDKTKSTTSDICKLLGTDFVAVSYSSMGVQSYGWFGGHAQISLLTNIYFYDKDGNLVAKGNNISKPIRAVGDDIMDYKAVLNTLPEILDKMMVKVSKKMIAKK
jgi:hypothetical protein